MPSAVARTVVVTGGAKGIGLAVVRAFAAAGDAVVALGRDEHALRSVAEAVQTFVCDVAIEDDVLRTFAEIGAVDVLVNNAGVSESAPLGRTTLESWRGQLDVNATGAFLCTRAVIDGMRSRGSGAIITVASTAGLVGSRYTAAYTASKHAAVGLMRAAAAELAGTGVTANAVCPGFVRTEMTERSIDRIVSATGRTREAAAQALGPLLEPQQVAEAVVFLANATSMNGQTLVLGGGEPSS